MQAGGLSEGWHGRHRHRRLAHHDGLLFAGRGGLALGIGSRRTGGTGQGNQQAETDERGGNGLQRDPQG